MMNMTAARLQRLGEVCESNLDRFFRQILSISQPRMVERRFTVTLTWKWMADGIGCDATDAIWKRSCDNVVGFDLQISEMLTIVPHSKAAPMVVSTRDCGRFREGFQ